MNGMFDSLPFGGSASVALAPVNLAAAAANSLWASVRDCNDFLGLLVFLGAGTATQDITITLQQATTSGGAGAKALQIKEAFFKRGNAGFTAANALVQDRFVKTALFNREVPANNYATAADRVATTNDFMTLIRISPKDLDMAGGFRYVRAQFNQPAAAQLAVAFWLTMGSAYNGDVARSLLA